MIEVKSKECLIKFRSSKFIDKIHHLTIDHRQIKILRIIIPRFISMGKCLIKMKEIMLRQINFILFSNCPQNIIRKQRISCKYLPITWKIIWLLMKISKKLKDYKLPLKRYLQLIKQKSILLCLKKDHLLFSSHLKSNRSRRAESSFKAQSLLLFH